MTDTPENILRQLGVDPEESIKQIEERKRKIVERHICTCGHSKARHYIELPTVLCKPSIMECACSEFAPIILVHDTRNFLHKTEGPGIDHALIKGLTATLQAGKPAEWLPEAMECKKCKTSENLTIYPIQGSEEVGFMTATDATWARRNWFLCEKCVDKI